MNKYLIEFIGTFFLVLVVSLSEGNPLAIGAVIIALVYAGGYISGAHYNPAVTLAIYLRGKIEADEAVKYTAVQVLGATTGAVVYSLIQRSAFVPFPAGLTNSVSVFMVEALFTCSLAFTVLQVATSGKTKGNQYYGLAISAVLVAGIFAGGAISGGVYNPAVWLGSVLTDLSNISANFSNLIIYLVAQTAGAALAAFLYKKTAP